MQNQEQVATSERPDYLEDLRRVQADFDNYRKRVLREQTQLAARASARLIERLLPVLDNFEAAISHGEGGDGVELVYKELRRVLEEEGLEEIPAEGQPFDPRLHEAFQAVEDDSVDEPTGRGAGLE
jgi:molecular chaperone GrpE